MARLAQDAGGFLPRHRVRPRAAVRDRQWGLFRGVLAGTALGAAAAWALTRLIAAFPILQWTAATVIALAMVLVVLSFF